MGLKLWPGRLHSYDRQVAAGKTRFYYLTFLTGFAMQSPFCFWMMLHLRLNLLLTTIVGSWVLAACQPATVAPTLFPTPASTPTPLPTTVAATPSPEPDVLIQPQQFNQPIIVQLDQTITILSPDPSAEWQVEFDPDLFEPQAPDEAGWRFKAVAAGQGLIVLTSVVNCGQPQPCPLMPRRMELTIEVKSP